MKKTVFGLVANNDQADHIVENLLANNFSSNDISILYPNKQGETGKHKGQVGIERGSKAGEGGAIGATIGGLLGGSLGLLAGIGALAIPGLGPFIAAGPIVAALSGSAIGGSTGLFVGALAGWGVPEYEAKKFEAGLKSGKILLCINAENGDQAKRAEEILERGGAQEVSSTQLATKSKNY